VSTITADTARPSSQTLDSNLAKTVRTSRQALGSTNAAEITRTSWEALGSSVVLVVSDTGALAYAREIVERELDGIDRACSRFRGDSDLMRANARGGRPVQVSPLLIEATEVALRAAELTAGDVDPTVGAALELAGYDRDWRLLEHCEHSRPGPAADHDDRSPARREAELSTQPAGLAPRVIATLRAGWQAVELDRERSTLRIPRGVKLDLGATAKAWAADRASRAVSEATGCGVLVSLGGDVSTAGPSPSSGWKIHVADDHRSSPDAPGQTVTICSGGLATSSTTVRRWRHEGGTMHHIIDPSTGVPAQEVWRTVSVAALDCTDANIAATAAIVRGEDAPRWLAGLNLPARLVRADGQLLKVGSWPQGGELR
jgi:thiamine biosynthesis lipoprotein